MSKVSVDIDKEITINIKVNKDISFSCKEVEELIDSYLGLNDKNRYTIGGFAKFLADGKHLK